MHSFDYSIPRFITFVRSIRVVVTLELIFDVLLISRVSHPDYPSCPHLKTVSKDELLYSFVRHRHLGVTIKTPLARA